METKRHLLTKINDFCLFVEDFQGALNFYKNVLGFEVKREQPGYIEFRFYDTSITIWNLEGVYQAIPKEYLSKGHRFMVAILLPDLQDVDDLYIELTSKGVNFITPPETFPWEARAAYFTDPEGNIWEIFAWTGDQAPGIQNP